MNKQSFSDPKKAALFIQGLLKVNLDKDYGVHDNIRITINSENYIQVEWQECVDGEEGFIFVGMDQYVMQRVEHPSGEYEYVFPEDVKRCEKEWHKAHPEWVRTDYGTWTNVDENRPFMISNCLDKWLEKEDAPRVKVTFDDNIEVLEYLEAMKTDEVLYRTSFCVFGGEALNTVMTQFGSLSPYLQLLDNEHSKFGKFNYKYTRSNWRGEEECIFDAPLYKDDRLDNMLLFVTDEGYVIGQIQIIVKHE